MFDGVEVSIAGSSDVYLDTPANGQSLTYQTGKWRNIAIGGSLLTASKNTAASGNITLTSGTSAALTKFAATLTANRTVTLSGTTANSYFDLSFIETDFNGFTVTVTNGTFSHAFSYPTYVRYVYIGSAWERVL